MNYLITLLIIITSVTKLNCECQDPKVILPCTGCQYNHIICGGDVTIDLYRIFDTLSRILYPEEKRFYHFYFNNTIMTEILNNTFQDITFNEIEITNSALKTIHPDAFMNTYKTTTVLKITNNTKLETASTFKVINKFLNLETLYEYDNSIISEIPVDAFGSQQPHLTKLYFNTSIHKLYGHAFRQLTALNYLSLHGAQLETIPENAFALDTKSKNSITIDLTGTNVTSTSFEPGSLTGINRPAVLLLEGQGDNFEYFPKNVMLPFLNDTTSNTIVMGINYTSFDCQDCRSYWLKKETLFSKITGGFKCSDGKAINDPGNFHECLDSDYE